MPSSGSEAEQRIRVRVKAELPILPDHLRAWVFADLTTPREISVSVNPEGEERTIVWLVTDHTSVKDSSSRLVYDPLTDAYGIAIDLANGVSWSRPNGFVG